MRVLDSPIVSFVHFHKEFPFNFDSTWVTPCFAGGTGTYEWYPDRINDYTNVVTFPKNILQYKFYYKDLTENEFLRAIGQQVTDFFAANVETNAEYISVGSYRRYLLIDKDRTEEKITMPPTEESVKFLTSDEKMFKALDYLRNADVIINRERQIHETVESQYLRYELPEYWNLFKEGIVKTNPFYKDSMDWFTTSTRCSYEGVYIMRKELFRQLVKEYFSIMEYIWENCSEVYPDKSKKQYSCSEPFPWRYPGFLNERFVPFFIHANSLRKVEVPLVFLG